MPPKTGPAASKAPEKGATPEDGTAAVPSQSEATEGAEDTTRESAEPIDTTQEPKAPVTEPAVDQRKLLTELYPEGTDLWYGEVHGLAFAFPRIGTIEPSRQWLRHIYNLTEIAQTFEWMALAKVPAVIQARTDLLTDDQYRAVFNAWFTDAELNLPK